METNEISTLFWPRFVHDKVLATAGSAKMLQPLDNSRMKRLQEISMLSLEDGMLTKLRTVH